MTSETREMTLQDLKENFSISDTIDFKHRTTGDMDDILHLIQTGQKQITVAAQDHEEANNSEKIPGLDARFKHLIDLENKLKDQKKSIDLMAQHIQQRQKVTDPKDYYEKLYATHKAETANDDNKYVANPNFVKYKQQIWHINHLDEEMPSLTQANEDDDIVMGPSKISLKCPLTTTWFENPVKSIVCKHTFSKAAIFSLLSSRSTISCPIPGCGKLIQRQQLLDDEVMADRVRRAKEKQLEEQATQFFDVE